MSIDKGYISINSDIKTNTQKGLYLKANLPYVNLDDFISVYSEGDSGSGFKIDKADIALKHADLFDRRFNNIKIEIYLSNNLTSSQYNQIAPFVDRILISQELTTYPIYNDPSLQRIRQVLIGAATNKTGLVTLFGNTLNGSGTQFINDIGLNNSIIINGNEYVVNTIVNNTQATVTNAPVVNITTPTTYSNYVKFAPIFFVDPSNAQSWMTSSPSKSYYDVYRLTAISGYTIGGVTQSGISPIAYNSDTDIRVTGSTYIDGMSIYSRTFLESIQNSVSSSPVPCSSCESPTTFNLLVDGKYKPNL